jgi:E3 ubiquitin-protein ligase DOA10
MYSKQLRDFTCACKFTGAISSLKHNSIYIDTSIKIYISFSFLYAQPYGIEFFLIQR